MAHFSSALIDARTRAGFKTAYAYYNTNGGRRVYPFSYAYYVKIERGQSLPRPEWLSLILRTMRILALPQRANLIKAYLRALSGEAYDDLFEPLLRDHAEDLVQDGVRNLRGRLATHLTPFQFRMLVNSPEASACFHILTGTGAALTAERIGDLVGRPASRCRRALELLRRHGLAKLRAGRHYEVMRPGSQYMMPADEASQSLAPRYHEHMDSLFKRSGRVHHEGWLSARLRANTVDSAMQGFRDVLQTTSCHNVPLNVDEDCPLYFLETRIRKLADFSA